MFFVFVSLLILSCVYLLVFPAITITREQDHDLSPAQGLLRHQIEVLSSQSETSENNNPRPFIDGEDLDIELVTDGLQSPTSMTFIGNHGDMIILEKSGEVIHFMNENKTKTSLLNFSAVDDRNERGLLGVATIDAIPEASTSASTTASNNDDATSTSGNPASNDVTSATTTATETTTPSSLPPTTFVFFYLTEASKEDKTQALGNRIYRFEWDHANKSLSNGMLLLDLPVLPGQNHNGGKLIADSDNSHLYAVIGDLNRKGTLQNFKNGSLPDDTSAIIRINPDGSPAQGNPFLNISRSDDSYANLSKYYAYGIRNSFGLAIDPLTGTLWDTENGPTRNDEINIVRPGFNSGWEKVTGPIERSNMTAENDLVNFLEPSSYTNPVFTWGRSVGVTDIEFYNSAKLGDNYTNNIFVGDFNNGNLYFFEVNEDRSGLQFEHPRLADDLVASNDRQRAAVIFGTGFTGGITDIETGPDGYLYILAYSGKLYRIAMQQ